MHDIPKSLASRLEELKASGVLDLPAVRSIAQASMPGSNPPQEPALPADTRAGDRLQLSQEPTKPTEPAQGAVPSQSPDHNAPRNLSGTNRPGEQSSGAVLEGKARAKPENRYTGPEGFQSRPGGEIERGKLASLPDSKPAPPSKQPTDLNIPMDRNVPGTRNMPPERANYREGRSYKAAPRRRVYLTSPK